MSLVQLKKTDYDIKITEIETKLADHNYDKYITTTEFNKLSTDVFNVKLPQANLVTKTDFDTKLSSLNQKINSNKSQNLLIENEFKNLKTLDSNSLKG